MIRNKLDELMWQKRVNVKDLAERSGLSAATVSQIKNHPETSITTVTLAKLCTALEVGIEELLVYEKPTAEDGLAKIEVPQFAVAYP